MGVWEEDAKLGRWLNKECEVREGNGGEGRGGDVGRRRERESVREH